MRKWGLVFLFAFGIFGLGVEREALAREPVEQLELGDDDEPVDVPPPPPNCPGIAGFTCPSEQHDGCLTSDPGRSPPRTTKCYVWECRGLILPVPRETACP